MTPAGAGRGRQLTAVWLWGRICGSWRSDLPSSRVSPARGPGIRVFRELRKIFSGTGYYPPGRRSGQCNLDGTEYSLCALPAAHICALSLWFVLLPSYSHVSASAYVCRVTAPLPTSLTCCVRLLWRPTRTLRWLDFQLLSFCCALRRYKCCFAASATGLSWAARFMAQCSHMRVFRCPL